MQERYIFNKKYAQHKCDESVTMMVLILFFLISPTDQLYCISQNKFSFSTESSNTTGFLNTIEVLQPDVTKNKTECRVELTLNYTQCFLEVVFDPHNRTSGSFPAGRPKLTTTFTLDSHISSIVNVLILNCSTKDACDRDFVLDRFSWLLNQNYGEAQPMFTKLLIREKNLPIRCFTISSPTNLVECKNEVCNGQIAMSSFSWLNLINHAGLCGAKDKNSASVRITAQYSADERWNCDCFYTCMYHGCNSKNMSYDIFNIILTSYEICAANYNININNHITSTTAAESFSTVGTTKLIQTYTDTTKNYDAKEITSPTVAESFSTVETTNLIQTYTDTTKNYAKEITSTTVLNGSFITSTTNTAIQDFQMLLIITKIGFSVLFICFFSIDP